MREKQCTVVKDKHIIPWSWEEIWKWAGDGSECRQGHARKALGVMVRNLAAFCKPSELLKTFLKGNDAVSLLPEQCCARELPAAFPVFYGGDVQRSSRETLLKI